MQANAVSPMNFKGQVEYCRQGDPRIISAGFDDYEIDSKERDFTDFEVDIDKFDRAAELSTRLVDADDVKGPVAALFAILYAGIKSFVKGAGAVAAIDKFFKQKPTTHIENFLKKGSEVIKNASDNLSAKEGSKALNRLGKILGDSREILASTYKKISHGSSTRAIGVCAGILSVAALLPPILKRDKNNDGIADIMQRSQNVYRANTEKIDSFAEKAKIVAEISEILT